MPIIPGAIASDSSAIFDTYETRSIGSTAVVEEAAKHLDPPTSERAISGLQYRPLLLGIPRKSEPQTTTHLFVPYSFYSGVAPATWVQAQIETPSGLVPGYAPYLHDHALLDELEKWPIHVIKNLFEIDNLTQTKPKIRFSDGTSNRHASPLVVLATMAAVNSKLEAFSKILLVASEAAIPELLALTRGTVIPEDHVSTFLRTTATEFDDPYGMDATWLTSKAASLIKGALLSLDKPGDEDKAGEFFSAIQRATDVTPMDPRQDLEPGVALDVARQVGTYQGLVVAGMFEYSRHVLTVDRKRKKMAQDMIKVASTALASTVPAMPIALAFLGPSVDLIGNCIVDSLMKERDFQSSVRRLQGSLLHDLDRAGRRADIEIGRTPTIGQRQQRVLCQHEYKNTIERVILCAGF